jgi:hypothetical protein
MEDTEVTKIPFEVNRIPDSTKPVGEEIIVQDGVDGTRTVVSIDGHVTSDRTIAPKPSVVYYGTLEEENVSTSELPQEETPEQPTPNVEVDKDSFVPPITGYLNQSQGRFSENKEILGMNVTTLKKAGLEFARLLVFAIPGLLITVLTNNPELGGSAGTIILALLKSVDRGIHEDKSTPSTGLLPF